MAGRTGDRTTGKNGCPAARSALRRRGRTAGRGHRGRGRRHTDHGHKTGDCSRCATPPSPPRWRANARWQSGAVAAVKDLSARTPNFHIPDWLPAHDLVDLRARLGARIDQPVMGMNVTTCRCSTRTTTTSTWRTSSASRSCAARGRAPSTGAQHDGRRGERLHLFAARGAGARAWAWSTAAATRSGCAPRPTTHCAKATARRRPLVRPQRRLLHQRKLRAGAATARESGGARIKYQYRGERGLRIENTASRVAPSRRGGLSLRPRPSREASPTTIRAPTTASS